MKIVAIIVTLVCCLQMFYVKREWKAALLVMGAMTLTLVNIPGIPLHNANFLLQTAFLLSEWRDLPRYFKRLRYTPYLWIPLLIVSFSALLATLTSPYTEIKETLKSELLFKYFTLAYAFWAVKDEKSLKPILQVSLYCLIALTFFGVLNYITKSADFVNAVTEGRTSMYGDLALGDLYSESSRFRVQSMFQYAFDYGYICAAILLLHLHGWYRHLESKTEFIIALVCCSFGILICGCRIVWMSAILSIACYSMWVFQLSRNVMYGIVAMMLMILSYLTIPAVEERVNQVTDIFAENRETEGSSISLRMSQYGYVLIHAEGHEWLGVGKGYWEHTYTKDWESIRGLYGVESVILQNLLERGIIGLVLWAAFYTIIFLYFWRNRKKRKKLTGLGVSILSLYLFFSIGTGELGSVYPTMLLLGFVIKAIEYQKLKKLYKLLVRLKQKRSGSSSSSPLRRNTLRLRLALLRHRLARNPSKDKL
jgi:O-antigen ligase